MIYEMLKDPIGVLLGGYEGGGGSGGGGTSAAYYKCASIDMKNKMWTGYLYDTTTKIFSETLTEGLSYNGFPTPTIGHIYAEDASLELTIKPSLSSYWSKLSDDIQAGKYTTDNVGDIIEVQNTATADGLLGDGTIQFKIVAIDNADLVDTSKQHSITLMATKVLFSKEFDSKTNVWRDSSIRSYLQNEFIGCLDQGFALIVAKVNRILYKPSDTYTVEDTVFCPSIVEVNCRQEWQGVQEGVCFDAMLNANKYGGSAIERVVEANGAEKYWLSSFAEYNKASCVVCSDGSRSETYVYEVAGVVPAVVLA